MGATAEEIIALRSVKERRQKIQKLPPDERFEMLEACTATQKEAILKLLSPDELSETLAAGEVWVVPATGEKWERVPRLLDAAGLCKEVDKRRMPVCAACLERDWDKGRRLEARLTSFLEGYIESLEVQVTQAFRDGDADNQLSKMEASKNQASKLLNAAASRRARSLTERILTVCSPTLTPTLTLQALTLALTLGAPRDAPRGRADREPS